MLDRSFWFTLIPASRPCPTWEWLRDGSEGAHCSSRKDGEGMDEELSEQGNTAPERRNSALESKYPQKNKAKQMFRSN